MEELIIDGKPVFICEHHHQVLHFWSKFATTKPYILTFDHHTDLRRAFNSYRYKNPEDDISMFPSLISQGDEDTINLLKHDEHIDAAIESGIIEKALVVSLEDGINNDARIFKVRQNGQVYRGQKIILNHNLCYYHCSRLPHTDDCNIIKFNTVIETKHLKPLFNDFRFFGERERLLDNWMENFILDIDLDYFHTVKSINPDDITFFKRLIKKAKGISIAKESGFINQWKEEDDSNLSVEYLLERLKEIIAAQ